MFRLPVFPRSYPRRRLERAGEVLRVRVPQERRDFLDWHHRPAEQVLRYADLPVDQILDRRGSEFVPEYPDDVHFRNPEMLRQKIERDVVIQIRVEVGADALVEGILVLHIREELRPADFRQHLVQQTGHLPAGFRGVRRRDMLQTVVDGEEQAHDVDFLRVHFAQHEQVGQAFRQNSVEIDPDFFIRIVCVRIVYDIRSLSDKVEGSRAYVDHFAAVFDASFP